MQVSGVGGARGRGAVAVALLACVAVAACDRGGPPPEVEAEARRGDAALLRGTLLADPTLPLLAEVRRVVDDDLPVRASELLAEAVLPAAARQADAAAALAPTTPDGRALAGRLAGAYLARLDALRDYQRALARGPVEDLALLDAVRALREAEQELASLHAAVAELAGEAPPEAPAAGAR